MSIIFPSAILTMVPQLNTYDRGQVGSPSSSNKGGGNMPMNTNSGSQTVTNNTQEGFICELSGNVASPTSYDANNNLMLLFGWIYNAQNRSELGTMAQQGHQFRLYSGSGTLNFRPYVLAGQDSEIGKFHTGWNTSVIDLSSTGEHIEDLSDGGSYNTSDVQAFAHVINSRATGGSSNWTYFHRMWIISSEVNNSNIPKFIGASSMDDLLSYARGDSWNGSVGEEPKSPFVFKLNKTISIVIPFQIGDGVTQTNFDGQGLTFATPANAELKDPRYRYTLNSLRVYVRLANSNLSNANFNDCSFSYGVESEIDFNVSNNSEITIYNANFSGTGNIILGSSVIGNGLFNMPNSRKVIINGANINGSTINGDVVLNSETDLTNITINGNLEVNISSSAEITFSNVKVTGDTTNEQSGFTLKINATDGTDITASNEGNGNGQVEISQIIQQIIKEMPVGLEYNFFIKDNDNDITIGEKVAESEAHTGGDIIYEYNPDRIGKKLIIQVWDDATTKEKYRTILLGANSNTYILEL